MVVLSYMHIVHEIRLYGIHRNQRVILRAGCRPGSLINPHMSNQAAELNHSTAALTGLRHPTPRFDSQARLRLFPAEDIPFATC